MPAQYTLPPDTRAVGTGNPPADMDAVVDALYAMGAANNILNSTSGGGADPTGTADSTPAIQDAINALPASGGTVIVPPGTYKFTSALSGGSGVTLAGLGAQASILHQTSTSAHGFDVTEASTYVSDMTIRDMQIVGPSSGTGIGVYGSADADAAGIFRLKLANVVVTGWGGNGIEIHNPILTVLDQVQSSFNGGKGIYLEGIPTGTSCSLTACYAKSNGGLGYDLANMVYSSLNACAADLNHDGYLFSNCAGVAVCGCGAESQTADNFTFSGGQGNTMCGCWTYQNNHYGLNVTASESGLSVLGFTESGPLGGAVNSIITASGTSALIANYEVTTATSFAAGTTSLTPAGAFSLTSGSMTLSPNIPLTLNGNLDISGAGYGLQVKEGSNCKQGTVALVAGSKVVSNTAVTANSRILLTGNADGGTPGWVRVSARTAGTSFTITSSSGTDTSTVGYLISEPG